MDRSPHPNELPRVILKSCQPIICPSNLISRGPATRKSKKKIVASILGHRPTITLFAEPSEKIETRRIVITGIGSWHVSTDIRTSLKCNCPRNTGIDRSPIFTGRREILKNLMGDLKHGPLNYLNPFPMDFVMNFHEISSIDRTALLLTKSWTYTDPNVETNFPILCIHYLGFLRRGPITPWNLISFDFARKKNWREKKKNNNEMKWNEKQMNRMISGMDRTPFFETVDEENYKMFAELGANSGAERSPVCTSCQRNFQQFRSKSMEYTDHPFELAEKKILITWHEFSRLYPRSPHRKRSQGGLQKILYQTFRHIPINRFNVRSRVFPNSRRKSRAKDHHHPFCRDLLGIEEKKKRHEMKRR